ncbi:MAG: MarR family transcriptional regulator [Desulfobacterales bacterium]|nr:MarR family transcriptional regulator [Desulfobacterales bacterium]
MKAKADSCIFFQLAKAHQAGIRFWNAKLADYPVTPAQGMVLTFLYENDRVTSKELGERTTLDSATLTGILDRLEKGALVERLPHPEDRRALQVCLTDAGRDLGGKLLEMGVAANLEFLCALTQEEQIVLRMLLAKLKKHDPC